MPLGIGLCEPYVHLGARTKDILGLVREEHRAWGSLTSCILCTMHPHLDAGTTTPIAVYRPPDRREYGM